MSWLPNAISLSRVGGIYTIPAAVLQQNPDAAFAWVLVLALTDFVDGMVARALRSTTQTGKEWIDPLSDFALAIGVLAGFVLESPSQWRMVVAATIITSSIVFKSLKQGCPKRRVRLFFDGFTPLYYVVLACYFLYHYASNARTIHPELWLPYAFVPLTGLAAYIKRNRLEEWLRSVRLSVA